MSACLASGERITMGRSFRKDGSMPSESSLIEAFNSTSPSRLSELSKHRDKGVRAAVAQNCCPG